jgi:hypothetical protein
MAVLGGLVSAHAPSKLSHKVAYVGAFVVLGCGALTFAIIQSRQTAKSDTESKGMLGQLATASSEATRLQGLNNKLQEELLELAKMNMSLGKQSIATVTGGDSFCYMDFMYQFGQPNPVFIHHGRYPLYDVQVRIVDLVEMRKRVAEGRALDLNSDVQYRINEFQAGRMWMDRSLSVPFSDEQAQDFNIFFSARNGIWTEKLRLRKVSGHWVQAVQVFFSPYIRSGSPSIPSKKPAYESVAKEFPRDPDGAVPWGQ